MYVKMSQTSLLSKCITAAKKYINSFPYLCVITDVERVVGKILSRIPSQVDRGTLDGFWRARQASLDQRLKIRAPFPVG